MTAPRIVVLDYGSGNLRSAQRALERIGAQVEVSSDESTARDADGLVVPGVGAFGTCMAGLDAVSGPRIIQGRLAAGRPVLGICVGLQVMFSAGTESSDASLIPGLGLWPGIVERLHAPVLPHMGWNSLRASPGSRLLAAVADQRFYFVHSYGVLTWQEPSERVGSQAAMVSLSHHGEDFVAAVEDGPLSAVQFHPEKSGDAGLEVLAAWLASID